MIEGNRYLFVMVRTARRRGGGRGVWMVRICIKCWDQVCFIVEITISLCYFFFCSVLYQRDHRRPLHLTKRWSDILEGNLCLFQLCTHT